jgi:hypothetical protein
VDPLGAAVALAVVSALRERRFGVRHAIAGLGVAYGAVHYVAQGKGWEYHLYPLAAFVSVVVFAEVEATGATVARWRFRWPPR